MAPVSFELTPYRATWWKDTESQEYVRADHDFGYKRIITVSGKGFWHTITRDDTDELAAFLQQAHRI